MARRKSHSPSDLHTSPRFGSIKPKRGSAGFARTLERVVDGGANVAPAAGLTSCRSSRKNPATIFMDFASLLGRAAAQERIRESDAGLSARSGVQTDWPAGATSASMASRTTDAAE
jgi:hypothetical protein